MIAGGLSAPQTTSITSALPIAIIMRHVADALKEEGWAGEICIDETNQHAFLEIVKEGEVDCLCAIRDIRLRGDAKR